jgi:putative glycosyltransferase (TIGR04372 family)
MSPHSNPGDRKPLRVAAQNRLQDLMFRVRYVQGRGVVWTLGRLASHFASLVAWLVLLPVTLLMHATGFRHATVFTERVGHLAIEPDCLVKDASLGEIPRRRWIILAPPGKVANEHLLRYWEKHFLIFRNPAVCFLIGSMSRFHLMRLDVSPYARKLDRALMSYRVYSEWGSRPPVLELSAADLEWGRRQLSALGIPEGSWFACVHAREGGYSPDDEEVHEHRNSDINNCIPAMMEIVARGGWIIRLGDNSMKPLPSLPCVIDYALHPLKSERMDVVLCATARFILGSTSGICLVGTVFGTPCAVANMVPTADLWYGPRDISIPKKVWSEPAGRFMSLPESIALPHGCFRYARLFADAGLRLVENSPADIASLAVEMMDSLEGRLVLTDDDRTRFATYRQMMTLAYASYFSCATFGSTFARQHHGPGTAG